MHFTPITKFVNTLKVWYYNFYIVVGANTQKFSSTGYSKE